MLGPLSVPLCMHQMSGILIDHASIPQLQLCAWNFVLAMSRQGWRCYSFDKGQINGMIGALLVCADFQLSYAAGKESDYVNTLTNLFKDIALAIDENEGFVGDAFGPEAVLSLISGLQQVILFVPRAEGRRCWRSVFAQGGLTVFTDVHAYHICSWPEGMALEDEHSAALSGQ